MNPIAQKETPAENPVETLSIDDSLFLFNRELSWLEFNRRVLEEALDERNPLLERLKFLSIFSTNLDEFFMIRVAGLKEQVAERVDKVSIDGLTAKQQLTGIWEKVRPMIAEQSLCLREEVLPRLAKEGIEICAYKNLSESEKKWIDEYFLKNVFPVLTPQAVDVSHPFPYISNLSLNLGLFVEPDKTIHHGNLRHLFKNRRFVRVKLPPNVSRLIRLENSETRYAALGELIAANIHHLLPNMKTSECFLFRLTRDADIELREDEAGDLLRTIESELHHQKRFSFPVRLEVEASMPEEMVNYLTEAIGLTEQDVYPIEGFLNIPDFMKLYSLDRPELKDKPIKYMIPKALQKSGNIFDVLKKRDILVHHPFTAYSTVTDFIDEAAEDENVRAIKICLYRAGKDSPVIKSLVKASRNGKQVAALVELKARFDEENNIEWARRLENEGVHVIYGMRGLKTHSKVALVVRHEKGSLRRYVHIATGNYNPTTSRIYTDLGLLTADEQIGADATDLFNFLTGYSYQNEYRCLLVAPINLRERMIEMINRETKNKTGGKEARIIVKTNSLTDDRIIRALYRASQAGVEIDLIVRGICVLRPGVKGLSENIRVASIVGRFLEHSRIFYFLNDNNEEIYIGSADWMHRNLDRRVEAIVPIKDAKLARYLKKEVLGAYLRDNVNAQILKPDGSYENLTAESDEKRFDSQMYFAGQEI
ncbi:MAG: polyphosphate kinase 1 [Acidobacteria bacterium]|jgi:polyphosphate kinase|nr:polyphosphate kinase 1 [Acidobacteriota bacterium]